ncbi:NADPH-dependent FMN reductase [Paenibacillus sp. RC84]|uniref:NADPH-dependent FMN reductase n=1 Tax=Paenibacillus sp. RC84 TaxID=3156252 RepID=UPI00351943E2
MKIAAVIGSNRKNSYNLKLAEYVQKTFKDRLDVEIVRVNDLPFYNEDIELNPDQSVLDFRGKIAGADAVLWVTPEYNYSIPGVLKNALDWLSRGDRVMIGKPSWIMGASMGTLGTVRAQENLRDILFSPGISSVLLPGNEVYVGLVHEKIDKDGNLHHEPTIEFLNVVVNNFMNWHGKLYKN